MLRSYFCKLLRSPYTYAGMLCIMGLCIFASFESLDTFKGLGGNDVYDDMQILLDFKGYRKAFIIFGAIPFASNFADEWNSKATINFVTRKDAANYAASNVAACFISSLLTVFIPLLLFLMVYSQCGKDFYTGDYIDYLLVFDDPFLSTVIFFLTFSVSCALWSVTGMALSAFFPSRYIAFGAPFILSNVVERITFNMPWQFCFYGISLSHTGHSALVSLGYSLIFYGGFSVICGMIFVIKVGKRVKNEIG